MTTSGAGYISISKGQIACLGLVARGRTVAEIARDLGISANEVERNLETACARLGVRTCLQASIVCTEIGML